MERLGDAVASLAHRISFSGVVWVDRRGRVEFAEAYGLADRAHSLPNTVDNQLGIASGTKGLTALTVVSLIEDRVLGLETPARSFLGDDLPLIEDDVTVEHLLAHRSGIGDYLDEYEDHDINEYRMPISVHELATTERYLSVLDGHPTKFRAGTAFAYSNGGYVVLALIAERASGTPFQELVRRRVCEPSGMTDTEFLRSDELPGRAAFGYVEQDGLRTNVFHLPVRGSGDGGIYTTAADISALWTSFFADRIVSKEWVNEMVRPHTDVPDLDRRYGLGFWLHRTDDLVILNGSDPGVSFRTVHDPTTQTTHSVLSNTSEGAWPMSELLDELVNTRQARG